MTGDGLAEQLARLRPQAGGERAGRVLASLERATLCACDVATLLGVPQTDVERQLEELAASGLVALRQVAGMPLYALTDAGRRVLDAFDHEEGGAAPESVTAPTTITMLQLDSTECASCAGSLTEALSAVDGVRAVHVDAVTGAVRTEHDHGVTREQLEAAASVAGIRMAGAVEQSANGGESAWWRRPRSIALAAAAVLTAVGLVTDLVIGAETVASALFLDRKSTRLNSSHIPLPRMPSSA